MHHQVACVDADCLTRHLAGVLDLLFILLSPRHRMKCRAGTAGVGRVVQAD